MEGNQTITRLAAWLAVRGNAGASEVNPVMEEHGWRIGRVVDPFGQHWEIGRLVEEPGEAG